MNRRLRWFDEGAPKLRLVLDRLGLAGRLPDNEDYYACPCCLTCYPRDAVAAGYLTEEHVPPKRLGGRGMLLTCAACNNSSGTYFDGHAAIRSDADDFARGRSTGRKLPVTSYLDGIPLRGTIEQTKEGIRILDVPKQNDPKKLAAYGVALNANIGSGNQRPNFSFTVHTYFDETRARISWIRSGYLAAFAALGYGYTIRDVMAPVRQQLQCPGDEILPSYSFRDLNASPTRRRVLVVDAPAELACVAVMMGEHTVFLPGVFNTKTFDDLVEVLARRTEADGRLAVQISGKEIPWPNRATYFLD